MLSPTIPPAGGTAPYDLGLEADTQSVSIKGPHHPMPIGTISPITTPWPPAYPASLKKSWSPSLLCLYVLLPLRLMEAHAPFAARAARTQIKAPDLSNKALTSQTVTEHLIGPHNMEMIYLSPHLYGHTFNETLDLCKCDLD